MSVHRPESDTPIDDLVIQILSCISAGTFLLLLLVLLTT